MKTLFLLVVLTQNGASDISASFANAETQQQCQQKALMLEGVLKASNIPIIEVHCAPSALQFSQYSHDSASGKNRNIYLVKLDETSSQVSTMPDLKTCLQQQNHDVKPGRSFCASSSQSLE